MTKVCGNCLHHLCMLCNTYSEWKPKEEDPESLSNQMKLLRLDYVNTTNGIDVIKRRLNNMEKILRAILKRVSL